MYLLNIFNTDGHYTAYIAREMVRSVRDESICQKLTSYVKATDQRDSASARILLMVWQVSSPWCILTCLVTLLLGRRCLMLGTRDWQCLEQTL